MHCEHERRGSDHRDRREVTIEIVADFAEDRLADGDGSRPAQQSVPIRRSVRGEFDADVACCARAIVDHELLAERLAELGRDDARRDIDSGPGRKIHDHAHGTRGVGLRESYVRERDGRNHQQQVKE